MGAKLGTDIGRDVGNIDGLELEDVEGNEDGVALGAELGSQNGQHILIIGGSPHSMLSGQQQMFSETPDMQAGAQLHSSSDGPSILCSVPLVPERRREEITKTPSYSSLLGCWVLEALVSLFSSPACFLWTTAAMTMLTPKARGDCRALLSTDGVLDRYTCGSAGHIKCPNETWDCEGLNPARSAGRITAHVSLVSL